MTEESRTTAHRRDEAGGPWRRRAGRKTTEDLFKSLGIRRIGPEKARRLHARLAVQRVDDQAGIFRNGVDGPALR